MLDPGLDTRIVVQGYGMGALGDCSGRTSPTHKRLSATGTTVVRYRRRSATAEGAAQP